MELYAATTPPFFFMERSISKIDYMLILIAVVHFFFGIFLMLKKLAKSYFKLKLPMYFVVFSMWAIIAPLSGDCFISSTPIAISFICFSSLIVLNPLLSHVLTNKLPPMEPHLPLTLYPEVFDL